MQGINPGQQIEALEDKTNFPIAHRGQLFAAHGTDRLAIEPVIARAGGIQAAHYIHQGRFARAAGADNGHKVVARDGQVDAIERV